MVRFRLDGVDWVSVFFGYFEMKFEEEVIMDGNIMVRIEVFVVDGFYLVFIVYSVLGVKLGIYFIMD